MTIEPGPELDALVATQVMGWTAWASEGKTPNCWLTGDEDSPTLRIEGFRPSTDIAHAWRLVEKLAPLVGDFEHADGFFKLLYGDSGEHASPSDNMEEYGSPCQPGDIESDDDDSDISRWSAHFHAGIPGVDSASLNLFPDGQWFCSRGRTAPHAICLASLKIYASRSESPTAPASPPV